MTRTESLFKTILLMQHLSELRRTDDVDLYYIDLFCGAGGTSTGVEQAKVGSGAVAKVIACVNHDKNAIASHMANHPYALHFTEDMRTLDLSPIVNLIKKIRFRNPNARFVLWASLECTNFSKAKGGQSRDADSRTLAEHLFRYIEAINPDLIQIENVEEFMAMYQIVDVMMRMLKIPELKRIMGFPENYKLIGTQAEQKKYIGNAVEVGMARVLCEALAKKLIELKSVAA